MNAMTFENPQQEQQRRKELINKTIESINEVRNRLAMDLPLLIRDIMSAKIIITNLTPTAAITSDNKLLVNPEFWNSLPPPDQKAVLFHEILHAVLNHSQRIRNRHPELWNIVCDCIVNKIIRTTLGENYVTRNGVSVDHIKAMLELYGYKISKSILNRYNEEELYDLLVKIVKKIKLKRAEDGAPDEGLGTDSDTDEKTDKDIDKLVEDINKQKEGKKTGIEKDLQVSKKVEEKVSGTCRDKLTDKDIAEPVPTPFPDSGSKPHPRNIEEVTERILAEAARKMKNLVQQKEKMNKAGTSPGELDELIESLRPRRIVDWKSILKEILRTYFGGRVEHTWKRPSRRVPALPGIMRIEKRKARIDFLIDTSGSIDSNTLRNFVEECLGVVKDLNLDPKSINIVTWDAKVNQIIPMENVVKESHIKVTGRGGTIIDDALKHAIKMKPEAVVVFTDGIIATTNETKELSEKLRKIVKVPVFVTTTTVPEAFESWRIVKYNTAS